MKPKLMFLIVLLLLPAFIISGCNIFGWTSGESTDSLIDEGKELMREADYSAAAAKFAEAMAEDPNSSDARYYHAKATIHASGFNALNLAEIISDGDFADSALFPFTGPDWPADRANSLFQAMRTVSADLTPIYNNQTTGGFNLTDIDLDLGLADGFLGILSFQDTDANNVINVSDFPLTIIYDSAGVTGFSITNLLEYYAYYQTSKQFAGKIAAPTPIDSGLIVTFNYFVDNIAVIINNAIGIITILLTQELGVDPAEVMDVLDEVIQVAHYYKVEIGVDNDGDGSTDEEVVNGLDDDGDGLIDEDSNGTWDPALIIP
jgi:hypothetical protein